MKIQSIALKTRISSPSTPTRSNKNPITTLISPRSPVSCFGKRVTQRHRMKKQLPRSNSLGDKTPAGKDCGEGNCVGGRAEKPSGIYSLYILCSQRFRTLSRWFMWRFIQIFPPTNYMGYCAAYLAVYRPSGRRELFRLSCIIM